MRLIVSLNLGSMYHSDDSEVRWMACPLFLQSWVHYLSTTGEISHSQNIRFWGISWHFTSGANNIILTCRLSAGGKFTQNISRCSVSEDTDRIDVAEE